MGLKITLAVFCALLAVPRGIQSAEPTDRIDFNRDIRPILSNRCFACHGPDESSVESGLRLDTFEHATSSADSGETAIIPGNSLTSELVRRINASNDQERMPPPRFGPSLTDEEIDLLTQWIDEGARYSGHWSFAPVSRPSVPPIPIEWYSWTNNPIDLFVLQNMLSRGLNPKKEADRGTLLRRLSLDLIGLPPTSEELSNFLADTSPNAFERQVDRLLASPYFGEHFGRKWMDLARYADSAGYADDPPRTIWAYRDWVIEALNSNMPFDQFTIEQLAGDLLTNATPNQVIATAFHRNTLTNNEGGTNDEEFRNVAVVDRVNTTMAVWMGVTMACAQCHNHKYDPISQKDYFQLFAILNQTEDADRTDESPTLPVFNAEQMEKKEQLILRRSVLEAELYRDSSEVRSEFADWIVSLQQPAAWQFLLPFTDTSDGPSSFELREEGQIIVSSEQAPQAVTVNFAIPDSLHPAELRALRIESVPNSAWSHAGAGTSDGNGNFVLTGLNAQFLARDEAKIRGRFVRVELPGNDKILSLAEVQVFSDAQNVANLGIASQSSTDYQGEPARAIDGNTDGKYASNSTTHSARSTDPWWELDLQQAYDVDRLVIHNRTDSGVFQRLSGAKISILDAERAEVWSGVIAVASTEPAEFSVAHVLPLRVKSAAADYQQDGFEADHVLNSSDAKGWAVGGQVGIPHQLDVTIEPPSSSELERFLAGRADGELPAVLQLVLHFRSQLPKHALSSFRVLASTDPKSVQRVDLPYLIRRQLGQVDPSTADLNNPVYHHFLGQICTSRQPTREQLRQVEKELETIRPITTVPILRELDTSRRRATHIQLRGNYRALGDVVEPGLPGLFDFARPDEFAPDRLGLARWLVDPRNPLAARVLANRFWESVFGNGLVRTSEEFGSQGELPTHPELLDWLASEVVRLQWDTKALLKLLVLSATYRQSSAVSVEDLELDPNNEYLARGPRFRLTAEQVRDQALAVSGLLSRTMYGEPVKPPQPKLGLTAAFGSGTDWDPSPGENRYRRGLYTTWRRSNPYPSMATFDAPNREVCTLRRDRTNTPLQALVTLNDPVYVEAAQSLARWIVLDRLPRGSLNDRIHFAYQEVLSREPNEAELQSMTKWYAEIRQAMQAAVPAAEQLATDPLGPIPPDADAVELATWTALANVLLNLDEVLTTR